MHDQETINIYNEQAKAYKALVEEQSEDSILLEFANRFTREALILDLGCGPAVSSAVFRSLGLQVDPVDASAGMVTLANNTFDINARQATFNDITEQRKYHGIWANFSLLHTPREEFQPILKSLSDALIEPAYLHLAMKTGSGSARDKLGRLYTYYTESELRSYLSDEGFTVIKTICGEDRGLDDEIKPWIAITSQLTAI